MHLFTLSGHRTAVHAYALALFKESKLNTRTAGPFEGENQGRFILGSSEQQFMHMHYSPRIKNTGSLSWYEQQLMHMHYFIKAVKVVHQY